MIYYNLNTINDWNFGDDNIIKVYKHGAVVFYKFDSEQGGYKVCYAVVEDITQYSDREFEDVYDKATEKWFKLNNLNQYEQYGIYGSGRNITYYDGKLTIDDGYEYIYSGSSWQNVGEVSGSSRVPQGYTEVEYIENTGTSYINTNFAPNTNTRIVTEMQAVSASNYPRLFGAGFWNAAAGINIAYQQDGGSNNLHINWYGRTSWSYYTSFTFDYNKHLYDLNKNYLYRDGTLVGSTSYTTSYQSSDNLGIFTYIANGRPSQSGYWGQEHFKGKMYSFQIYDNDTLIRDLVPCVRDNDNTVGAYDIVNNVFYTVPTGYSSDKLVAGTETGSTYPLYYDEIQDPPNNVSFSSMTEAEEYECPWVGMKATIDGVRYVFSGDSQSGYEWVENTQPYTEVEYIQTVSANTLSGVQLLNVPNNTLVVEIDAQLIYAGTTDGMLIGQKSKTEAVSYQMGFDYYNNMFYDYGGGRLSTSINRTMQYQRHTYRIGRIDSSNTNKLGVMVDGVLTASTNVSNTSYENLPYLVGNPVYSGTSVVGSTKNTVRVYSVKIYEDYGATLVGDYIPVIKEDGTTITLYDKVSGNYATPYGTLIAGDPV